MTVPHVNGIEGCSMSPNCTTRHKNSDAPSRLHTSTGCWLASHRRGLRSFVLLGGGFAVSATLHRIGGVQGLGSLHELGRHVGIQLLHHFIQVVGC
jgi:hypothetical protein